MDVVVREPIEIDGRTVFVGCSIGQAVFPDDGMSSDQLALTAGQRMYKAKAATC